MQQEHPKQTTQHLTAKHFEAIKQELKEIPKQQRQNYISQILAKQPNELPPPQVFEKEYQHSSSFKYQQYKLHYYCRENTDRPKAIVVHFHGMSSHGGTSGYFSWIIANRNKELNFYALDQLNFGKSQGPYRGLVSTLDESAEQGEAFVNFLLQKFKQRPKIFLCGSSYGGSIIFKMALNSPKIYAGAIFLNPALRNLTHNLILQKIGVCLGWLLPRVRIPVPQSSNKAHKYNNAERLKKDLYYYNDGLVPGSVRNVLNGINQVSLAYKLFDVPFVTFQGRVDKLVDLFAPLDLQEESPSADKTTIYLQNLWHSIFNQQQIQVISEMAADWLHQRL